MTLRDKLEEYIRARRELFKLVTPLDDRAKGGLDGRLSELEIIEREVLGDSNADRVVILQEATK